MRLDPFAEKRGRRLMAAVALVAGCLAACGGPPPSVVLVSLDAVRADHLGAYGYARDTTPFLDSLAGRGYLFEQAIAPSGNTLISHASLLTGLPAWAHGANYRPVPRALHPAFTTLAEELAVEGYETGAFVAHGDWLTPEFGIDQGFATFSTGYRSAEVVLGEAADWLETRPAEAPFFLFLHLYDAHSDYEGRPYQAPEPFRGRWAEAEWDGSGGEGSDYLMRVSLGEIDISPGEAARLRDQYDEGIAYLDDRLRAFFAALPAARRDGAWIVVVADHGEAFLEHGKLMHLTLHDEVVRVPLLAVPPAASAWAGATPARITRQVRLVDVRPTLLSLAGLPAPEHSLGADLTPCLRPGGAGRDCPSPPATLYRAGLRHDGLKLLRMPEGSRLYDLERDPGEMENLAGRPEHWRRQQGMQRLLAQLIAEQEAFRESVVAGVEIAPPRTDPEAEERLRALGYLN